MQIIPGDIGKAIRLLRTEKNLSQEVFSGLVGIARTHLSMIETGNKSPNFDTICRIAEAFQMRPSELVKFIEEFSGYKK